MSLTGRPPSRPTRLSGRPPSVMLMRLPPGPARRANAGIMPMPHQDVERSLFDLGHVTERLIEGVHIFWLKGGGEDGSRSVPATVGQLVNHAVDDLRDLVAHGLDENVRQLAEEVGVFLVKAWNVYERYWWGPEHQQLVRSIENSDGYLSVDEEETLSPLATPEWSRFQTSFRAMLAALPEDLAVWADAGGLKAQSLVSDTRDREHLQILVGAFPTYSLHRVLRAMRDHHPAVININLHFLPTGVYGVEDRESLEQLAERGRMTAAEANQVAHELAEKDPTFVNGGAREWADAIGKATGKTCSPSTVHETPFWRQVMKETGRGRTKGKTPRAVALTGEVEATHGEGGKDAILNELIAQEEAAVKALQNSTLPPESQQAVLEKLNRRTMTLTEALELAALYPPKPARPIKPFRQV